MLPPIYWLPAEILTEIIHPIINAPTDSFVIYTQMQYNASNWVVIRQVCRLWQQVADATFAFNQLSDNQAFYNREIAQLHNRYVSVELLRVVSRLSKSLEISWIGVDALRYYMRRCTSSCSRTEQEMMRLVLKCVKVRPHMAVVILAEYYDISDMVNYIAASMHKDQKWCKGLRNLDQDIAAVKSNMPLQYPYALSYSRIEHFYLCACAGVAKSAVSAVNLLRGMSGHQLMYSLILLTMSQPAQWSLEIIGLIDTINESYGVHGNKRVIDFDVSVAETESNAQRIYELLRENEQ